MAKQTKSQKKQSGKIKRTPGWFKPITRLKGMLLFALAFASIGGGILIYKSYATTYTVHVKANTIIKGAYIDHCYMQYMGGNYGTTAYTQARVRSTTNGRPCRVVVGVTNLNWAVKTVTGPIHTSTDWSVWTQAQIKNATFRNGSVLIFNIDTNKFHTVNFTVY